MFTCQHETSGVLSIAGELHISEAEKLRSALAAHLQGEAAECAVDLSAVKECDTASLQLIYSMHMTAVRAKKSLAVLASSGVIQETCAALGLSLEDLMSTHAAPGLRIPDRGGDDGK